jgi:hypothetical protein
VEQMARFFPFAWGGFKTRAPECSLSPQVTEVAMQNKQVKHEKNKNLLWVYHRRPDSKHGASPIFCLDK